MSVRTTLARVTNASALSVWTWALAFAPSVTTAVLHDRNLYGGSALAWLSAAIAGALAAGIVLVIARLIFPQVPPLAALLSAFALAGAARGVGVGLTADALGLVTDPQISARMLSGAILAMFWLSIASVIVDGIRTHRETMAMLRAQEIGAQHRLDDATSSLEELRASTQAHIITGVEDAITELRQADKADPQGAEYLTSAARKLMVLSSGIVRTASHSAINSSPDVESEPEPSAHSRTRAFFVVLSDTFRVSPFPAIWLLVVLFPSILTTAIRAYGVFWGIVGAAWIVVMAALVLALAQRIIGSRLESLPSVLRIPLVFTVWFVSALASTIPVVSAREWGLGPERAWAIFGVPLLAYVPITCFGIALAIAVSTSWAISEESRASRLADLTWSVQQREQSLRAERTRWGRHLHGSVQSTLTSTALFLENSADTSTDYSVVAAQAIDRLIPLLSANSVDQRPENEKINIRSSLDEIAGVWSRLADIDIDISTGIIEKFAEDTAGIETVVEIVREGISNAVRHGRAQQIWITIKVESPHALMLTITDNGSAPESAVRGMGSATLDELCLNWSREAAADQGMTVRCELPLNASNNHSPAGSGGKLT